jgi:D-alanyl-D-alanine carboxypeptidase
VLVLTLGLAACTSDTSDPDTADAPTTEPPAEARTIEQAEDATQSMMDLYAESMTGVVVTVRVGEETATVTAGLADTKAERAMKAGTRLQMASNTKMLVATLVMQEVEAGGIALDDTVEHWLPGLVPDGDLITVDMLLSHRSGLPDWFSLENPPLDPYDSRAVVKAAVEQLPPMFAPGESSRYSNTNYDVLALVLGEATGQDLGRLMRERIWDPAGMTHSTLGSADAPRGSMARGYFNEKDVTWDPLPPLAAGGLVATTADLELFLDALFAGELLAPEQVEAMTTKHADVLGHDYGYGIFARDFGCGVAWGHDGGLPGFNSLAVHVPELHESVVVAINESVRGSVVEAIAIAALCG